MSEKTIAVGCDHAGFPLKQVALKVLEKRGYEVLDFGTHSEDSVDYPDFVHPVGAAIDRGEAARGIVICGSGNGVAITANKHQHVRAALCWNEEIASLARRHNDANVIALPARFLSPERAATLIEIFLDTPFEGGRHARRVGKIPCSG